MCLMRADWVGRLRRRGYKLPAGKEPAEGQGKTPGGGDVVDAPDGVLLQLATEDTPGRRVAACCPTMAAGLPHPLSSRLVSCHGGAGVSLGPEFWILITNE